MVRFAFLTSYELLPLTSRLQIPVLASVIPIVEVKRRLKKVLTNKQIPETDEGLDIPQSLRYFARLRFVYDLLPLLLASSRPRVVSILGGGLEKKIDLDDIEVKNDFSAMKAAAAGTTRMFLLLLRSCALLSLFSFSFFCGDRKWERCRITLSVYAL